MTGARDEEARLRALAAAEILDTPDEARFDDVARLAATTCGTPMALISFGARDRHWFKARYGLELREMPRTMAFCNEAIERDELVVVPDAAADPRFRDRPQVVGYPFVRFYAGQPVRSPDGHVLGSLCVADVVPRVLEAQQRTALEVLARQVEVLLDLRTRVARAEATERRLMHLELLTNAALDVFLFLTIDGAIVDANPRAEDFYGYTVAELRGMNIRDLRLATRESELKVLLREAAEHGSRFETQHRHKGGRPLHVEISASPLARTHHGNVSDGAVAPDRVAEIFTIVRDIGDRVEVARIGGTVRAIMQNLQDGVVVTSSTSRVVQWNAGAERILGYKAEEILGEDSAVLFAEPSGNVHREFLHHVFHNGSWTGEIVARDRFGADLPLAVSASVVNERNGTPALCVTILRDIRMQVEREQALERAKVAAETANRLKSRFLGNMTHELRTPLNAILGFARVLQKGRYGELNERQRAYVQDVLDSGEHMLTLVTDLLDLQRAEEGRTQLTLQIVSIKRVAEDALRMVRELAAERKHEVSLELTTDPGANERETDLAGPADPKMLADPRRLVQVLVNLLGNAITYTPPGGGGRIRLLVQVRASEVTFAIEDNGVGISSEDQARLFREFERLGDLSVGHGFGIGLALSKRLVEEHGGTIRAESQAGSGSRFIAVLPRRVDQMDKWKQDQAAATRRAAAATLPDAPR